jgi:hypothetical protein
MVETLKHAYWAMREHYQAAEIPPAPRQQHVKGQHVAEDSSTAMLTYAAGFKAQDIGPDQPFGIWEVGLPMPPQELVKQSRLVTHANKYKDAASLEARDFFRARRDAYRMG